MSKRSAIGIFNGNWKNKWRRELEDMETDRREFIIQSNKLDFGDALKVLKAADPEWESWYDRDENIPPYIRWLDTEEVKQLCLRMIERAQDAKKIQRRINHASGEEFSKRSDGKIP